MLFASTKTLRTVRLFCKDAENSGFIPRRIFRDPPLMRSILSHRKKLINATETEREGSKMGLPIASAALLLCSRCKKFLKTMWHFRRNTVFCQLFIGHTTLTRWSNHFGDIFNINALSREKKCWSLRQEKVLSWTSRFYRTHLIAYQWPKFILWKQVVDLQPVEFTRNWASIQGPL